MNRILDVRRVGKLTSPIDISVKNELHRRVLMCFAYNLKDTGHFVNSDSLWRD